MARLVYFNKYTGYETCDWGCGRWANHILKREGSTRFYFCCEYHLPPYLKEDEDLPLHLMDEQ